jgi:two-component system, NtrC family, response regulator AtoC
MNTILVAEDEPEVRNYFGLALKCHGYNVQFAQNGEEVLNCLEKGAVDISLLLLDLIMPCKDGFETLEEVRRAWPGLPVITISGSCTPADVACVLKGGASDFLSKPVGHDDLLQAVRSVLDAVASTPEPQQRAIYVSKPASHSPKTWSEQVQLLLNVVGTSDVPVLLRGETGVGKEVLARQLHERSKRAGHPFLKLNCAALPSELVESELFGYERGAFTGAFKNTPGKFELANGGTILLDEIGDMDFKLQAKLLQVLQDREFLRLGARDTCKVDVRVMAATHCDLEKAITEGRFRQDLYYRLNIVEVQVPPLRERKHEIPALAEVFLRKYSRGEASSISSSLLDVLLEHDWPGNVRELENVIRKYLIFKNPDIIRAELRRRAEKDVSVVSSASRLSQSQINVAGRSPSEPMQIRQKVGAESQESGRESESVGVSADESSMRDSGTSHPGSGSQSVAEPSNSIRGLAEVDWARKKAEQETITAALNSTMWNRKRAAKLLRIDYKALLYKMKKLGIGEERSDSEAEQSEP